MSQTTDQQPMTTTTIKAGTKLDLNGIPVQLAADTQVQTAKQNVDLINRAQHDQPAGVSGR
jgi:hypothetical protein